MRAHRYAILLSVLVLLPQSAFAQAVGRVISILDQLNPMETLETHAPAPGQSPLAPLLQIDRNAQIPNEAPGVRRALYGDCVFDGLSSLVFDFTNLTFEDVASGAAIFAAAPVRVVCQSSQAFSLSIAVGADRILPYGRGNSNLPVKLFLSDGRVFESQLMLYVSGRPLADQKYTVERGESALQIEARLLRRPVGAQVVRITDANEAASIIIRQ